MWLVGPVTWNMRELVRMVATPGGISANPFETIACQTGLPTGRAFLLKHSLLKVAFPASFFYLSLDQLSSTGARRTIPNLTYCHRLIAYLFSVAGITAEKWAILGLMQWKEKGFVKFNFLLKIGHKNNLPWQNLSCVDRTSVCCSKITWFLQ